MTIARDTEESQRLPGGEVVSEAERAAEARAAFRKQAHPAAKKPRGSPAMGDALRPLEFRCILSKKQEIIGLWKNPNSYTRPVPF